MTFPDVIATRNQFRIFHFHPLEDIGGYLRVLLGRSVSKASLQIIE